MQNFKVNPGPPEPVKPRFGISKTTGSLLCVGTNKEMVAVARGPRVSAYVCLEDKEPESIAWLAPGTKIEIEV